MGIEISQEGRPLRAKTPLADPDALVPVRLRGSEGLSVPYWFVVDFLSATASLPPADLLGKGIGLMIFGTPKTTRLVHGRVSQWTELGTNMLESGERLAHYRAVLVPTFGLLSLASDCRTFENRTVKEIVETVFEAHGFKDFRFSLMREPPRVPYVVQYQESDFAFVSRLLEDHGLHYTFEHLLDKHVMVITDRVGDLVPAGVLASVPMTPFMREADRDTPVTGPHVAAASAAAGAAFGAVAGPLGAVAEAAVEGLVEEVLSPHIEALLEAMFGDDRPPENTVIDVYREFRVHTKTMAARDFHLLRPADAASVTSPDPTVRGERFEFLGDLAGTTEPGTALATANQRLEVEESGRDVFRGTSTVCPFVPGTQVEVAGAPGTPGIKLHLVEVRHSADAGNLFSGEQEDVRYVNQFTAIPVATQYRPARTMARPSVRGTQTAEVVGEGGAGQIDVDAHGRVLLRFPWDRGDGKDGRSTHRVHVASLWAGAGWGEVHLPRVGQLVLVEFLEGDPDRPIVTGRVYSREHAHPYALPANKTQSGVKSRSVGGGDANFNELRFEDKKGEEHVFLQAEKDHQTLVKHDETRTVGHDRTTTVLNHDTRTVGGKDKDGNEVGGNDTVTVTKGNRDVTVSGNLTTTVSKGHMTTTVSEGNETHEVTKGTQTVTVEGDVTVTVKAGNHATTLQQGDHATTVQAGNAKLDVTSGTYEVSAAQKVAIEVGGSTITLTPSGIEIKIGASAIKLSASGVEISGPIVKVNATGQAEIKSAMVKVQGDGMLQLKAPMSQVNGDGMLMAKGGITMIN